MKKFLIALSAMLMLGLAQSFALTPRQLLAQWKPGEAIDPQTDNAVLMECFTASHIPDSVFARMQGKSYKKGCLIPRTQLRYLTVPHYDGHGAIRMGELVCDSSIANDLTDIFRHAFAMEYPIERMVLIDDYNADDLESMNHNNTSCFNYRVVAGSKKLSNHARGLAIDVNPFYNPYVKRKPGKAPYVSPPEAAAYSDRKADYPYKITTSDPLYKLFIEHGFEWGGSWESLQDYQHFEKNPAR